MRNIKLQESLQLSAQWIVQKELQHTLKTKIKGAKLFVVRANLLHPPYILVSLWFIIIFLVFFYLSKLLFFFNLKAILYVSKITQNAMTQLL